VSWWIENNILNSWTVWWRGWCKFKWKLQTIGSFELHHDNAPAHTALSVCEFLAKKVHSCAFAGSLLSRFVTLWILLVPKIEIKSQGLSFLNTWQCWEACNQCHQDPKRSSLPILLWCVENLLGQVCCIRGMLFWKGQCWFQGIIEKMILYKINVITSLTHLTLG
jgi:hypothetical protein